VVVGTGKQAVGTTILLGARPNTMEWRFDHWSGDVTGRENPLHLHVDGSKRVTAHFAPSAWVYKRVVADVEPKGAGEVRGVGDYAGGATATLEAVPAEGWVFSHWTGDADGKAPRTHIRVDDDRRVGAHFVARRNPSTPAWATPGGDSPGRAHSEDKAVAEDGDNPPRKGPLGKAFR
jgi:hypothetical protein